MSEDGLRGGLIVAPADARESVAVVTVVMAPGTSIPIGPPFRFEGWLHGRANPLCACGKRHDGLLLEEPTMFHVEQEEPDADG